MIILACPVISSPNKIVGRERRERVSQLDSSGGGCFDSRRRVNSTVRQLTLAEKEGYA